MKRSTIGGRNALFGRYFIEAVGKAIDVLWAFHGQSEGLTIEEAVAQTRIAKSTVYRLLCTLVETGIIEFESNSGKYFLGPKYFQLATSAEPSVKRVAGPFMKKLWTQVQETINLGILSHGEVMYLSRIVSPHPFRLETSTGGGSPIHCTALGKAMAAYLPWEEVEQILRERKMVRFTSKTITNPRRFAEELEKIHDLGYAVDEEEAVDGGRCIAAPILNAHGRVAGALSISGPATRITHTKTPQLATAVMNTCREISAKLGYSQ